MILYFENKGLLQDMIKEQGESCFSDMMNGLSKEKRKDLEQIMLYLITKETEGCLEEWEKKFVEKYNLYLDGLLKEDFRVYYNNEYCLVLLDIAFRDDSVNTFFGRDLRELDQFLVDKYEETIGLVYKNETLSEEDKEFLINNFISSAHDIGVYKDEMPDIVAYVERYPIEDIGDYRNRCLKLLYLLALELRGIKKDAVIKFESGRNCEVLGSCYEDKEGIVVVIYDMNIYYLSNVKEFLGKLFTLYHELGHVYQSQGLGNYNKEILQRFEVEEEVIRYDRKFYDRYHDNFLIEKDADNYAINRVINGFGNIYPVEVDEVIDNKIKLRNRDMIDDDRFLELLEAEYVKSNEISKKR